MNLTEQQWKEFSKYCLDNGQRKLTTAEKEVIKMQIDRANDLNELLQIAFASLIVDSNR